MAGSKYADIPATNPDTATADMLGRENESRKRLADLEAGLSHPNLTAHEIMGLASQAALDAHTASLHDHGGVLPSDYVLTRTGTTYSLIDGRTQAEAGNGAEPGALLQAAITALAPRGGRIDLGGREDFAWGSIPTIPAGLTRRLTIASTGPHVQLSVAAPRFLDPGSIDPNTGAPPPGSTFQNVTLDGIVLDADAIKTDDRGGHHLLFGNARAGALYSQINFSGLRFLRCKVLNGRTANGSVQNGVYLATVHTAAGQPRNFVRDVIVDDLEVTGCLQGVALVGIRGAGFTGNPDIWIDGVTVRNVRHDIGSVPAGFSGSAHVHIGSYGMVGQVTVENTYGYGSRDVGIEINNYHDATVDGGVFEEYNGYAVLLVNHRPPLRLRDQRAEIRNASGRHLAANAAVLNANASSMVAVAGKAGLPQGDITVKGVSYYRNVESMANLAGIGLLVSGEARSVSVEDATVQMEGINHTSTTQEAHAQPVYINPTNLTPVKLRNVQVRATGAVAAGAAAHSLHGVKVTGSVVLDADDIRPSLDLAGAADFVLRGIDIGAAATTIKGTIRRFKPGPMSATQPRGIVVGGTATVTIPDRLDIVEADFSQNATTSLDVVVGAGNEDKVHYRAGSIWRSTAQNPERWRVVGASGEPAFVSPWRAFTGFQVPRFRKVGNLVYLDGVLGHDGAANASTAFVLPVGYRPAAAIIPYGLARLDVDASGNVICRNVGTGSFHPMTCSFWVD